MRKRAILSAGKFTPLHVHSFSLSPASVAYLATSFSKAISLMQLTVPCFLHSPSYILPYIFLHLLLVIHLIYRSITLTLSHFPPLIDPPSLIKRNLSSELLLKYIIHAMYTVSSNKGNSVYHTELNQHCLLQR